MATQADLDNLARLSSATGPAAMPPPPALPNDIKQRFPSMQQWEDEFTRWATEALGLKIQQQV